MLGFGALGQLALGELPQQPVILPGSGAAHRRFAYLPEPPVARPAPPFRPIWDRNHVQRPKARPQPVPLPPAELFMTAPPLAPAASTRPPFGLPDFNELGSHDPMAPALQLRDAYDAQDVNDAIAGLLMLGDR